MATGLFVDGRRTRFGRYASEGEDCTCPVTARDKCAIFSVSVDFELARTLAAVATFNHFKFNRLIVLQ